MNNITNINNHKPETIDSREVANQTEERHADVIRKINTLKGYIETDAKLRSSDYFIESNYKAGNGEIRPCYLLTVLGCELYVNKLSGKKGTLFTAFYTKRFHEMDEQLRYGQYANQVPTTMSEALQLALDQQKQLEHQKPKVEYFDHQMKCKGTIKTGLIAENYGMTAQKFNKLLHKVGIQYKQGSNWVLYSKYRDHGYTAQRDYEYAKNHVSTQMLWTPKGKKMIYDVLKKHGIVPSNERPEQNELF